MEPVACHRCGKPISLTAEDPSFVTEDEMSEDARSPTRFYHLDCWDRPSWWRRLLRL